MGIFIAWRGFGCGEWVVDIAIGDFGFPVGWLMGWFLALWRVGIDK
jgi:hypothetical protein